MTLTTVTTSLATAAVLLTSGPAHAAPPASRTCQPTFDSVASLAAAVDYLEEGWGRSLDPGELVPAPADPVPQAVDNRLPVR